MQSILFRYLLFIFLLLLTAACRSQALPGKWRVTKSWPETRPYGIAKLEFTQLEHFNDKSFGKVSMVLNNGMTGGNEYNAYEKNPLVITMSRRQGDDLFMYAGIYKFEDGKLILKLVQNLPVDDYPRFRPPQDFSQQPEWDFLELEREK